MTEEADEAVESAKSEVNSHPLKMEIEIEEEIKEDRAGGTHKSYNVLDLESYAKVTC